MILEAAILTFSCVLFVQMGLSEAVQQKLHFHSTILSCPKCLTFWAVLILSLIKRQGLIECVAASFLFAYTALWLALIYDIMAAIYNTLYERITNETDTKESPDDSDDSEAGDSDAVS